MTPKHITDTTRHIKSTVPLSIRSGARQASAARAIGPSTLIHIELPENHANALFRIAALVGQRSVISRWKRNRYVGIRAPNSAESTFSKLIVATSSVKPPWKSVAWQCSARGCGAIFETHVPARAGARSGSAEGATIAATSSARAASGETRGIRTFGAFEPGDCGAAQRAADNAEMSTRDSADRRSPGGNTATPSRDESHPQRTHPQGDNRDVSAEQSHSSLSASASAEAYPYAGDHLPASLGSLAVLPPTPAAQGSRGNNPGGGAPPPGALDFLFCSRLCADPKGRERKEFAGFFFATTPGAR